MSGRTIAVRTRPTGRVSDATLKPAVIKQSAGLLVYRETDAGLEIFLVHPGGPFFAKKDDGVWSIPKGEYDDSEDALEAAKREFAEETGLPVSGPFLPLGSLKQPSRKTVSVWAFESDCDPAALVSNEFEMEWPPGPVKGFIR